MKRIRAYSRAEQKERILNVFVGNIQRGGDGCLTMNFIARELGLVASQHVTDILHELNIEGELIVQWQQRPGRWTGRMWMLANDKHVRRDGDKLLINGVWHFFEEDDLPY